MQVALICPTAFLDKVARKSRFHMCLSPVALRDDKYAQFYRERSIADDFVLLDNGVFEDGRSVGVDDLLELARTIDVDELIIPDVLYESEATVRSADAFINKLATIGSTDGLPQLMAVPQGRSIKEWLWCYERLVEMKPVDTIGLSCLSISMSFGGDVMCSRIACCELLESLGYGGLSSTKHQYHLLGCGNPLELVMHKFAERKYLRSCDTSSPFVSGVHGIRYGRLGLEGPKIQTKVNFDWQLRDFSQQHLAAVKYNVDWLLEQVDG